LLIRRIYEWTLRKAVAPAAEAWLASIAFIESSVFLIPADVLFVPMALAKPAMAYRYALTATLASSFGGIAGYYLGHYAYEEIAKPILDFYGKLHTFEHLRSCASGDAVLLMLVTSGLAHVPPIKVVTILSGAVGANLWLFIICCILARGARFFALAWALKVPGALRGSRAGWAARPAAWEAGAEAGSVGGCPADAGAVRGDVSGLEREAFSRAPGARPRLPVGLHVGEDAAAYAGLVERARRRGASRLGADHALERLALAPVRERRGLVGSLRLI
jgi:membrane protein YqaA with SNARE-associated domain